MRTISLAMAILAAVSVWAQTDAAPPLREATSATGPATVTRDARGWSIAGTGAITARVTAPADAFLCRLAPGTNPDVVQLAVGRVTSRRCNALYSPLEDLALEFVGADVALTWRDGGWHLAAGGPLQVVRHAHFMRDERGLKYYRPLDRSIFRRAPSGWCSWYIYWTGVTEQEMVANTDWIQANLARFGATLVQLDDGWQGVGAGLGRNRDWTTICQRKFPSGLKALADHIKAAGLVPGLWLVPFGQSNEAVDQANPGVFLRNANGRSVGILDQPWAWEGIPEAERMVNWCGSFLVDPTSRKAQDYLKDLFRRICLDWGYDYVKIDGQGGMASLFSQYQKQLANPALTGDQAYRLGLEAMKSVMGRDRFLLNCGSAYDSAGLCEGIRTGGDVGPNWSGLAPAIQATLGHLYQNTIAFYTDPDVVCVRGDQGGSLSLDQARLWSTLYGITGQMTLASDNLPKLPDERVELLRRIMPVADVRPMELYPLSGRPRLFDVRVAKPGVGEWDVVAAFGWKGTGGDHVTIDPVALGLPAGRYVYYDVWHKQLLGTSDQGLALSLAPTSCRVVAVRPATDQPQLLGTSRHLLQGADDLLAARWDAGQHAWSGRSELVGGDPYELRFTLPPGWTCTEPGARLDGAMATVTLRATHNLTRAWRVQFQPVEPPVAAPVVAAVTVTPAGRAARVTWAGRQAVAYRVYRDGKLIGQTGETSFVDHYRAVGPVVYAVAPLTWTGEAPRAMAAAYQSPPPPRRTARDAWLDEVQPLSALQTYGTLARRRSIDGNPLRIGGRQYPRGLGAHAESELVYALNNSYQRFEAEVGVDDEKGGAGTVRFLVLVDGRTVFDSGVMKGQQPAKRVSVSLEGAEELTLQVTDAGDGINCDHADWGDARLVGNR